MQFSIFANYLQKLEAISSRLEMTAILAELLQKLEPAEIAEASYLMQGQLRPSYASMEFQIAVKTVIKALARVSDAPMAAPVDSLNLFDEPDHSHQESHVTKIYKELGDLGLVTEKILTESASIHHQPTIVEAYQKLFALAQDSGVDSQQRKLETLVELLKTLDPISGKFVIRIILGRLRLGFSDMTMIDSLSWAMTGTKSENNLLEDAYQKKADIGKLAEFYLQQKNADDRQKALTNYKVELGVPIIPALCQRLNSAAEMIEKMHDVIAEPKYDGLRVQIHIDKKNNLLRTFTRNLEETSHMFPELHTIIDSLDCDNCILDAEAIGYDPQTGHLLPFQQTIQRKRKHDVSEKAKEVPIRFYVFDLLFLNGKDLIQTPLIDRKTKLDKLFSDNTVLYHSPVLRTTDPVTLHNFHAQELQAGLEGVVVKQVDSIYQSGRKGWSWVKMKEAEGQSGKLSDTLDVVVLGYYAGRGKRAEFGIGAILVGILESEDSAQILTIAKIGTGLTDEQLRQTKQECDKLLTKEKPAQYNVPAALTPDIWCLPGFVVEVAADEVTISPMHSAGLALRFPRLEKFREDKTWKQATTLAEVKQIGLSPS